MQRASILAAVAGLSQFAFASGANAADFTPTKFEAPPPAESAQIAEMVELTGKLLEQRYGAASGETMARRAVHPKAHGCVKADFTVNADLPEKYRIGVFAAPGKTYPAWIRYSNATAVLAPDVNDKKADSRGMAIKLMGVEGETLLGEPGGKTQDFLLINQPMFAFPNVAEYDAFTRLQVENKDNVRAFFPVFFDPKNPARMKIFGIVTGVIQPTQLANPLDATYFSASPFLFGKDKAAKFAARPRNPANPSPTPDTPDKDYLRLAMKKSLAGGADPVLFDFQVQLRPDGLQPDDEAYPIESANTEWKPKSDGTAAWQNVAVITIRPQDFDQPLQASECEHLVFTPWHGLVDHQPLGGINRLRREVYLASSKRRAQTSEPTGYPRWPM
ncbi:catalase family protein [Methylocystis parvus]|uniref:catalase family protein n=1 Tax=Methylocystis parvus TaxID=134 RepID=UPI003C721417